MQSETIQELTKTSQALASLQEQASELRKVADALKAENVNIVHAILVSLLFWGGGGCGKKGNSDLWFLPFSFAVV